MTDTIMLPTDADLDYASKMLAYAGSLALEHTNTPLEGTLNDLTTLQALIENSAITADMTVELQALGLAFGMILANNDSNYDWWTVDDETGRNLCIRFKETALLLFPQTMISRRIEEGLSVQVTELYQDLKSQLETVEKEQLAKSCA